MASLLEEGLKLFRAHDVKRAADTFQSVLEEDASVLEARYLLGVCHFRQKHYLKAEECFRSVSHANPKHHEAWYYLGLTFERQSRHDDAHLAYRIAVAVNPTFAEAKVKLNAKAPQSATNPLNASDTERDVEQELREAGAVKGPWTEKRGSLSYTCTVLIVFVLSSACTLAVLGGIGSVIATLALGNGKWYWGGIPGLLLGLPIGVMAGIANAGSVSKRI